MAIAAYGRVSTTGQNLDRQLQSTHEYAIETLDHDLGEIKTYRGRSTVTETYRSGYRVLIDAAESGVVQLVVVKSVSRIARSIRELDRTAERVTEAGAELQIIDDGLVLWPDEEDLYQDTVFPLGVFLQLETEMAPQRTREGIAARQQSEDYHH